MKDNAPVITTTGNLPTGIKTHEAGIDIEGKQFLFSILSNQYSNKEKAVLREYTTNAWDAHVEAGNTNPIEVTLPSDLQPTLLIQDYGTGLTQDEIFSLLGNYGASTKRDSNATVGKMGIGSKSAITLVSQYVVTAVKDGLKNVVVFGLNDNGILEGKVVPTCDNQPTDEPNGVLISLAVDDIYALNREADLYFSKWDTGKVLVNGQQPECVWEREDTIRLNDNAYVLPDHDGGVFAVMGQVSYEISRDLLRKVRDRFEEDSSAHVVATQLIDSYDTAAIFLHVEIGDVDIAPSRESVMDSFRTLANITRAIQDIADTVTTKVQVEVDAQPNAFDGIRKFEELRTALKPLKVGRKSVTYKGLSLREIQKIDAPAIFVTNQWRSSKYVETVVLAKDYDLESNKTDRVVVVKVKAGEENGVKRTARRFLDGTQYSAIILAVDNDAASYGWFTYGPDGGAPVLTLEEYRAEVKALREIDPAIRTAPEYTTGWGSAKGYDRDLLTDILSWGKDIILFNRNASADAITREALGDDYTIVVLSANQTTSAFRKRVEKDGSVRILSRAEVSDIVAEHVKTSFGITEAEKEALGAYEWLENNLYSVRALTKVEVLASTLGVEGITSRAFLDALDTVALARLTLEAVPSDRLSVLRQQAQHLGLEHDEYVVEFAAEFPNLEATFPLLARLDGYHLDERRDPNGVLRADVIAYINAR